MGEARRRREGTRSHATRRRRKLRSNKWRRRRRALRRLEKTRTIGTIAQGKRRRQQANLLLQCQPEKCEPIIHCMIVENSVILVRKNNLTIYIYALLVTFDGSQRSLACSICAFIILILHITPTTTLQERSQQASAEATEAGGKSGARSAGSRDAGLRR